MLRDGSREAEEVRALNELLAARAEEIQQLQEANSRLRLENQQLKVGAAEAQRLLREDRLRAARILHDEVAQDLAYLMLKMEILTRLASTDLDRMRAELSNVTGILEHCVDRVRSASHELSDPDRTPSS